MVWLWVITIALVVCAIVALFMVVGSAMRDPRDPGAGGGFELWDGDD
ncbi:hypothetical protein PAPPERLAPAPP_04460 [Brevundimonas phage vB_BpoS-Papperlapapp]|uniref:Uncharacterized protein n=2 Tax=Marchewkavirus TaxID=3425052 RepID=A0A9E7MQ71_9CAUD|nr:hypothetical protein KABACHOK_02840 [Brevundimonas phage vB_BpoS-Kabachok]USN14815.1 hypothetical protein DOMOVOI_03410 [Brevundimonas phage vB_BpoS-Domovoi]USN16187.1 hypothetical protein PAPPERLAPAPP_04460 [Brevundimonas phage vB_BpoS-Papperlapapp]